jgi:hypothetical protein
MRSVVSSDAPDGVGRERRGAMILLFGIPSESPLALVRERLDQIGAPYLMVSQRRFADTGFWFEIADGPRLSGELRLGGDTYPLDQVTAVYTRLMDDRALPELRGEPVGSPVRQRARLWHDAVMRWYEIAPIRVVNPTAAMWSNASKPFQAQAIVRHSFRTPETLVTTEPSLVGEFVARHGRVIFKSMSGVRSIVRELHEGDLARLDAIRWCPVQFQAFVPGQNVRVHTVGDDLFATAITTGATDYRYAQRQAGEPAVLEPVELGDEVAERCLALAHDLELPFAGIDLKVTPDDEVYCLEVNPSPAYSYYESHTGQPISAALARYLAGKQSC